jgi:hypothetical protein
MLTRSSVVRCVSRLPCATVTLPTSVSLVPRSRSHLRFTQSDSAVTIERNAQGAETAAKQKQTVIAIQENPFIRRFKVTAEITVSKLFPGGFGWQAMGVWGGQLGLASTSWQFAALTGLGDALGVGLGHLAYKAAQSAVARARNSGAADGSKWAVPDLAAESQTALWLASAAMCSGTIWQPAVNALMAVSPNFVPVAVGTGAICGAAFYTGLRLGRSFYGGALGLKAIAPPSYTNLKADAWLSMAVGGASACFVSTDFGLAGNGIKDVFGVRPDDSAFIGMVRAGGSTAAGFAALQTLQNILPENKNWLDPGFKA